MSEEMRLIGACLSALGQDDFARSLLALAERTGARQVMVFALGETARCLMSRNYARRGLGEALAERYLDGWWQRDPLRPGLARLQPGQSRLVRVSGDPEDSDPATIGPTRMGAEYRRLFFDAPGLSGKTAVLIAGQRQRLIVNLYEDGEAIDPTLAEVIARLVVRHFDAEDRPAFPPALSALSARERAVCLGILEGRKAEAIAGSLGVSAETVVTYRKRAYHKLGITSRGALFAICRGG